MAQWIGVNTTRIAWEAPVSSASQRLMLLAIAKYADQDGKAFPSVESLCSDTCLNKKTAFKVLKELREAGVIAVHKRPENNGNCYSIVGTCTKNGTTDIGTTKNGTTGNGTTGCTKNGTSVVPKTEHEEKQEEKQGIKAEENSPAPSPETGTGEVSAADLCPSVDSFTLSNETPKATEKPKRGKASTDSILKPDGVSQKDWDDFKRLRKEKRMPLTQRALEKLQREAAKAGKTLAEVLVICLENSWASFGADWRIPGQSSDISNVGTLPDQSRNPFYFPDGGRPNRKTTEVPRDYDATAEAADLVGRMLG